MHVGLAAIFQNPGKERTDLEVYQNDLRLASLGEGLGFESIWGVEHHFTGYTMCPDVLQYLSYFAGSTKKVKLGSMVVVLPPSLIIAEHQFRLQYRAKFRVFVRLLFPDLASKTYSGS